MPPKKEECPLKYTLMELKSLVSPPQEIKELGAALVILLGEYPVPETTDDAKHLWDKTFEAFRKSIGDGGVTERLKSFDVTSVTPAQAKAAKDAINHVTEQSIRTKSMAALELFKWVKCAIDEAEVAAAEAAAAEEAKKKK